VHEVKTNLGVIDEESVNIVLHGHEPILSEKIVEAVQSAEMQEAARSLGAKGIKLIGMCCTVNEVLMRKGIEVAGNHLHQELAVMTGVVEALVVDVQCIFPAMADLSRCFHTRFISTSRQALFPGGIHIPFMEERAGEIARTIVRTAVEAFPLRDRGRVHIPREVATARVGFGVEEIRRHLGGSLEPLAEALASGRIRGIAGIVGCNNPKVRQDHLHINLTKELISRDILVVGTGCWAIGVAKAGLMDMAVLKETSVSLRGFCLDHDIPPVLHMGSCVDCSRMLQLFGEIADLLGRDIPALPLVAAAPEWATEKALAIALYFAASGLPVQVWPPPPVSGSHKVVRMLTEEMESIFGGYFFVEEEPEAAVARLTEIIEERRRDL
jgi:carbon-monoxide dehydrogenase catalytic subunit